jgi:lipid-binding SYLF domain-containing protein
MKKLFTLTIVLTLALGVASTGLHAASRAAIDARIKESVETFYGLTSAGKELAEKSAGMLVFPKVTKAGIGVGGERGNGALLVDGKAVDYYTTTSASVGLQLGGQTRSQIILFMTEEALDAFQSSTGWEVGVDASVALATIGTGGELDTEVAKEPVIGFIFGNKGLMYNLSLEGSKISKSKK